MKNLGLALGLTLTLLLCLRSNGADFTDEDFSGEPQSEKRADPVSELRNRDSAFSLLIEAFRQLQSRLIQTDYEARLRAAAQLDNLKTRRQVVVLAKQERDLRLKKLYGQVATLNTTYDYSRKVDEREAHVVVPSNVDTAAAARKLKDFVVITPASAGLPDSNDGKTIPASVVLADGAPTR
jgi:hypothetical protein